MTQAAVIRSAGGGSVDAHLQEIINVVADDLADDGELNPTIVQELSNAQYGLNADEIMAKLQERLHRLGSNAQVPNIHPFLDSDGDGLFNDEDNCSPLSRTPSPQ